MRKLLVCSLAAFLLILSGCSSGSKPISVTIVSPMGAQNLDLGQSFNIMVQVNNDKMAKGATFSVTGVGTLSNTTANGATYMAPTTGAGGNATITIASASDPMKTVTINVVVTPPPSISNASSTLAAAIQGVAYAGSSITVTGGAGALTYSISAGALPTGLMLNSSTGAISGTATAAPGMYSFTVTVKDTSSVSPQTTSKAFIITLNQQPTITSANNATFVVNTLGTFTVTTTASPTAALSETGALPTGVNFTDNGDGTATIKGTPTATGNFPITIGANNGIGTNATQNFTLTVGQAPAITSAAATTFTVGSAGNFAVTTGGFPAPMLSETGALPNGVMFVDNGNGTAKITGTPATGTGGTYNFTVKAHNGIGSDATQPFVLTVDQAPAITSANATSFTVGSAGSFAITTTGFPKPALTHTGSLPTGVMFVDNGNGTATLSGIPAAGTANNYPITIIANNGVTPNGMQTFTLTVGQGPAISSGGATTFTVGSAGTFNVTATGFPAPALTETGARPGGVMFMDNGNGTATLSGTPAAGSGGTYNLSIKAHNGFGTDATQPFVLTVNQAPAITSVNSATFSVGAAGTFTVTTSGFPNAALTETGALPTGVTFTDNHNGTATIMGTATAQGTFPIMITANNGVTPNATQNFTLTVNTAPAFTSANNKAFTVGTNGSFTVTTTGTPTPALTETGTLPANVMFHDNGDGTATLSGTPAAGTGGTYNISFKATNTSGSNSQAFTLTVDQASAITSANSTTFTVGVFSSFTVMTSGFPKAALSETGALPTGVMFVDNHDGTATLSGTPASGTANTYPITITANNGVTPNGTQAFTLTVNTAPVITSANNTTFAVGTAGTFAVMATGTPTPTLTETGALPGGVTFVDNHNGTATLSGTPGAGTGGTYPITIKASSSSGNTSQTFTLTVNQAPAITSANSTTFNVGAAGSFTVTTTAFPMDPITETGALPMGVMFVDNGNNTATLSGTPAAGTAGSYPIIITASNGVLPNATQNFTLTVNAVAACTIAGKQLAFELLGDTSGGLAAMVGSINVAVDGSVSGALDFRNQSTVSANQAISGAAGSCSNASVAGTGTVNFTAGGTARTLKFAMRTDGKQGFVVESDASGFSGSGQIEVQSSPATPLHGSYGFGLEGASTTAFFIVTGAACTNSSGTVTFIQADIGITGSTILTLTGAASPGALSAPDANGRVTTTTPLTYSNGTMVDSTFYNIDGNKAFVLNTSGTYPGGSIPVQVGFLSGKSGSTCLPTTAGSFTNSSVGNSVFSAQGPISTGAPAGFIGVLNNFNAAAGTASITDDELQGGAGAQGFSAQSLTYSVSSVGRLTLSIPNQSGGNSNSYAYLDGTGNAYLMVGNKNGQGFAFGIVAAQTATTVGTGTYAFGSPIGAPSVAPITLLPVTEVAFTATTLADMAAGGSSGNYTCDAAGRCTAPSLNNGVTFGDNSVVFYVGGNTDSSTTSAFIVLLQTKAADAQNGMLTH